MWDGGEGGRERARKGKEMMAEHKPRESMHYYHSLCIVIMIAAIVFCYVSDIQVASHAHKQHPIASHLPRESDVKIHLTSWEKTAANTHTHTHLNFFQ